MAVRRNEPCPCGSGRKHKHCCGAAAAQGLSADSRGSTAAALALASRLLQGGQLDQAEQIYRRIVAGEPANAEAVHFLGMCLFHAGRRDDCRAALRRSVELAPDFEPYWRNLGIVLLQYDELAEAEAALRRAICANGDSAPARNYLAIVLQRSGHFAEAVNEFERALALNPGDDSMHNNLAYTLLEQGQVEQACAQLRRALALNPNNAMAHNNLGNAQRAQGDIPGGLASYRRAVAIEPGLAMARFNLGRALVDAGQPDAALEHLRAATRLAPEMAGAWQVLADVLAQFRFAVYSPEIEAELLACFAQPQIEPAYLAQTAASLLAADARFREALLRGEEAEGTRPLQFDAATLRQLARPVFLLMLENALIPGADFEALICRVRRAALFAWAGESLGGDALAGEVLAAIAHQCFLSEYVHAEGGDETGLVLRLQEQLAQSLAREGAANEIHLALLACYRPLHEWSGAAALPASASQMLARLVLRQVSEPAEEARIRSQLPALTVIGNAVSRAVQGQYEQRPYPRWMRAPSTATAFPLALRLRTLFPHSLSQAEVPERPTILIAGCGTGRHVAITAMLNPDSRILAVDLSRSSLAYAVRRAGELGLRNVEFAQADILELAALERRFDLIECSGVLHHMQDPAEGWRVLAGRLNPGGRMKLGLYSEIGRRSVVACRQLIAERGYAADAEGMRAARAEILARPADDIARSVADSLDFYSLSGCRDLLFHVQERRYSLGEIETLLATLQLEFLGFEFESRTTLFDYQREHPDDPAAVSLGNWSEYESRHPDTFSGMYQFWVASRALPGLAPADDLLSCRAA